MPTTPILAHGTWGNVVAIEHNGTRIDRPPPGQSPFSASWTATNPDHPEISRTVSGSCMLPNTDPRVMAERWPEWAALIADGTITEQMLEPVPQPAEESLATARTVGSQQARRHFDSLIAAGLSIDLPGGSRRIAITDAALAALVTILSANAGQPDETEVVFADRDGLPIATTLGVFRSKQSQVAAAVRTIKSQWSAATHAILGANTVGEAQAALDQYRGT